MHELSWQSGGGGEVLLWEVMIGGKDMASQHLYLLLFPSRQSLNINRVAPRDAIPDLGTLVRSQPACSQPYTEFFQFSFLTENFQIFFCGILKTQK